MFLLASEAHGLEAQLVRERAEAAMQVEVESERAERLQAEVQELQRKVQV
jgi:hypothetical protein